MADRINEWTDHDTEMCEEGEKSGVAINKKTGKPYTWEELRDLPVSS